MPQANLYVIQIGPADGTRYSAGQSITVTFSEANTTYGVIGASASASLTGLYLSTDSLITSNDLRIGSVNIPVLPDGYFVSGTIVGQIPITLPPGNYYLGVYADYNNQVAESNETNNASTPSQITVLNPQPDLDVVAAPILANSVIVAGGLSSLHYEVDNFGGAASAATTTGIYLSSDSAITTSDLLIGVGSTSGLPGGYYVGGNASFVLPANIAAGTYYIGAIVDDLGFITESNETNNASSGAQITVIANPFTDGHDTIVLPQAGLEWFARGGNDNVIGTSGNDVIHGNEGDDQLRGGDGADQLFGDAGSDILTGGLGDDAIEGGDGTDYYYIDSLGDKLTETNADVATGGYDYVISSVNFTLGANFESLWLEGAATSGTGNGLDNIISGLYSHIAVTLDGAGGDDVIYGSTAGGNTLIGGVGIDTLLMYGGNNVGNGGLGSDIYYTYTETDVISELGGDGIDTLFSNHSLTIAEDIEQVLIYGDATTATSNSLDDNNIIYGNSATGAVTLSGGGGSDVLFGGSFGDTLSGGTGVDLLFGFGGANSLQGGDETDVYYLESGLDSVNETVDGGFDTIYSKVAGTTTVAANVEQLILYGAATGGLGNADTNYIYGSSADQAVTLDGAAGDDYLRDSAFSGDVLIGGIGSDQLDLRSGGDDFIKYATADSGSDFVYGFDADAGGGQDLIDVSGRGFNAGSIGGVITIVAAGADTLVTFGSDTIMLIDVLSSDVNATDFKFT